MKIEPQRYAGAPSRRDTACLLPFGRSWHWPLWNSDDHPSCLLTPANLPINRPLRLPALGRNGRRQIGRQNYRDVQGAAAAQEVHNPAGDQSAPRCQAVAALPQAECRSDDWGMAASLDRDGAETRAIPDQDMVGSQANHNPAGDQSAPRCRAAVEAAVVLANPSPVLDQSAPISRVVAAQAAHQAA